MKRFKTIFAASALVALSIGILPLSAAFSDVGTSSQYSAAIKALEQKGIIEGYVDGSFKPLLGINRAEFLKILLEGRGKISSNESGCFPDVQNEWFAKYVCFAKKEGIVGGYPDGYFRPGRAINFVEASKMLSLAYKQNIQEQSSEWYEPYARALEGSKAIPPSIASLDAPLKRGEMAEMMWRLSEEKTDQPTKGYLNVKYPDMKINLASDEAQLAKSCADLKAFTESASSGYGGGMMRNRGMTESSLVDSPVPAMALSKAMDSLSGITGGGNYSQTNVQVEGVDEGDRVKTDGSYLYIVSRRDLKVRIVDIRDAANPKVVATIASDSFVPQDLYIDGDTLAVTGMTSQNQIMPMEDSANQKMMIWPPMGWSEKTTVKLFDVSNKASPKESRTVAFEGNAVSSRMVGGKLLLVMNSSPRWYGPYMQTKEAVADALVPLYDDSAKGVKDKAVAPCDRITILPRVPHPQYLLIAAIPLQSASAEIGRTVILGNGSNIYASLKNLYIASPDSVYSWRMDGAGSEEKTNVYRFEYTASGTQFKSQGRVPGHILNQFSMDEMGDTFRIATTKSPMWGPSGTTVTKSTNNLYVLNASLETLGSVEDIAPGESIYSVRFMGNRAYMVTFKQVDPLFVIDLTNARAPKILGKLKIPGFSNYLHPVDENHLLGFGKEVDESIDKDKVHSDDAVYYTAILGMKIALFDVTDVENPKEVHKEVIGARGTDSPLLSDHKALLFDRERGLLAFPVAVYEKRTTSKQNEWDSDTFATFQGAYVYDFGVEDGFTLKGKITHHTADDFMKSGDYWYDVSGLDIDRIVRIGSNLATLSEGLLKLNDGNSLQEKGSVKLATEVQGGGYYPIRMMQ